MDRDLKAYFTVIGLPAVAFAIGGLLLLHLAYRQGQEDVAAARHERGEGVAKHLQQAMKARDSLVERTAVLRKFLESADTNGTTLVTGAFIWKKGSGAIWHTNLTASAISLLGPDMKWRANQKKGLGSPRGWFPEESSGDAIAWARLGNSEVAGLTIGMHDNLKGQDPTTLFAAGICLVALLSCSLSAGGWLLARAAHRAREESLRKATFIDNLSHELKMPLAVVRLKIERLLSGRMTDPGKLHAAYQTIASENNEMIRQIDALLELVRTGKGTRRYTPESFDMAAMAREMAASFAERFAAAGISVVAEGPVCVRADVSATRQIICNLLDNAAKYAAAAGPVTVKLSRSDGMACMSVIDCGTGIPAHLREAVFDRFYRIDDDLTRTTGGAGIGLSLARCFARDMGGDITVSERNGGGCVFTLQLPEDAHG